MSTALIDALERRAGRGERRDPAAVIATARAGGGAAAAAPGRYRDTDPVVTIGDDIDLPASRPIELGTRRRPIVLATAAAVSVLLGLGALALRPRGDGGNPAAAVPPEPGVPLSIGDDARAAAVGRCQSSMSAQAASIVDRRPDGLFVGLLDENGAQVDTFRFCLFTDRPLDSTTSAGDGTLPHGVGVPPDAGIDTISSGVDGPGRSSSQLTTMWVWGRVGPRVTSVVVATSSGNHVATIEHGLYAAWWAGPADDRAAVHAYDRSGRTVAVVDELECTAAPRVRRSNAEPSGGCPEGRPADDLLAAAPPTPEPAESMTADERAAAVGTCHDPTVLRDALGAPVVAEIVDKRAAGRFIGRATSSSWFSCVQPSPRDAIVEANLSTSGNSPDLALPAAASPAAPLVVIGAKSPDGNMIDGNEATWVWGWVDPSVASVVVSAPSGTFRATVEHGLFAAWWPGNDGDRAVVRALDAEGREIAFVDQLNCGDGTGIHPRLVVGGTYVTGGCPAGHDLPPGVGGDGIPDPVAPSGS